MKAVCAEIWTARTEAAAAFAAVAAGGDEDLRALSDADLHAREEQEAAFAAARTRLQVAASTFPAACVRHMCATHPGVAMATTLSAHLQHTTAGGTSGTRVCDQCKHAPATQARIQTGISCARNCECDVQLCTVCWTTHADAAHTAASLAWRNADDTTCPADDVCIIACPTCTGKFCLMAMGARRPNIRASAPALLAPVLVPTPPPPPAPTWTEFAAAAAESAASEEAATTAAQATARIETVAAAVRHAYSTSMGLSAPVAVVHPRPPDFIDPNGEEFHLVPPEVPAATVVPTAPTVVDTPEPTGAAGAAAPAAEGVVFVVDDSRLDSIPHDYHVQFADTMDAIKKMRLLIADVCKRSEQNHAAYNKHGAGKLASDAPAGKRRRAPGTRTFECRICHMKNAHYANSCPDRKKDGDA